MTVQQNYLAMMDKHVAMFLRGVKIAEKSWVNSGEASLRGRYESAFSAIWTDDSVNYEHMFLRKRMEYHIRRFLVNPILKDLFTLYGINTRWPYSDQADEVRQSDNRSYERTKQYEFIVSSEDHQIAYRYTYPDIREFDIEDFLRQNNVSHIDVVDWFDASSDVSRFGKAKLFEGTWQAIHDITLKKLFLTYFDEALFAAFMARLSDAVSQANEIIGLKTIRQLTPDFSIEFKVRLREQVKNYQQKNKFYANSPEAGGGTIGISKHVREIADEAFFGEGMYRSLFGNEDFAQSFITAEYLVSIIDKNDAVDYTPIILDYIKAVEQLQRKLMNLTFEMNGSQELWIKKNSKDLPPLNDGEIAKKHPTKKKRKGKHVRFIEANRDYFETTLKSLSNFLADNDNGWNLRSNEIGFIRNRLCDYATFDRNGFIHENNLTSFDEMKRIRSNTFLLLYLLLGTYKIVGIKEERLKKLGADACPYSELRDAMSRLSKWDNMFFIQFDDSPKIKVAKLSAIPASKNPSQESQSIRFAIIEEYDSTDSLHSFIESLPETDFIEVSRDCMPNRMWLLSHDGNEKLVWSI